MAGLSHENRRLTGSESVYGIVVTSASAQDKRHSLCRETPSGADTGLDQVNVLIPAKLTGAGNVNIHVTAVGMTANASR